MQTIQTPDMSTHGHCQGKSSTGSCHITRKKGVRRWDTNLRVSTLRTYSFTHRSYFPFNQVPLRMLLNFKPMIVTSPSFPSSQIQTAWEKIFPFVGCSGGKAMKGREKLSTFRNVNWKMYLNLSWIAETGVELFLLYWFFLHSYECMHVGVVPVPWCVC